MDGEQMHTLIGTLYQQVMLKPYDDDNLRTFGQCRQSTALASSYPYVMYSDLYDHEDFVRGMASASCSGILWTPEVRFSESTEELIRRIQAAILTPQTVLNCYQVPSPPWKQWDYHKNMRGEFLADADYVTDTVRNILKLRMQLIPYLYEAYYRYYKEGVPAIRPLVMDYTEDLRFRAHVLLVGAARGIELDPAATELLQKFLASADEVILGVPCGGVATALADLLHETTVVFRLVVPRGVCLASLQGELLSDPLHLQDGLNARGCADVRPHLSDLCVGGSLSVEDLEHQGLHHALPTATERGECTVEVKHGGLDLRLFTIF
jgi:hypothetical protein